MATARLTFGKGGAHSATSHVPVYQRDARSESVTTSGASAKGVLIAGDGEVCTVFCDSAVIATPGENPTATEATGRYCPANIKTDIKCAKGDVVALIDA